MTWKRILIFGLGRTGLALYQAARKCGIEAVVVDESDKDSIAKPALLGEAQQLGVPLRLGWKGELPEGDFDAVVVNPAIRLTHPYLVELRRSGMAIVSEIEFSHQIANGPIVAITGTNGKSTTTVMTWLALASLGRNPLLCGNLFGSGYPEQPLASAAASGLDGQPLVAEVSSFQLDGIQTFRPHVAAITNISPDHSDRYDTFESYAKAKFRIFENQRKGDWAIVDAENIGLQGWQAEVHTAAQWVYLSEAAQFRKESMIVLGREVPLEILPFREAHNHRNAAMALILGAALIAESYDARFGGPAIANDLFFEMLEGLKAFKGLAHRMERVGTRNGIEVINNSMCTNPVALISSLSSIPGRALALIGGVSKDLDFSPVGEYLRNSHHVPYLYGRDRDVIARQMELDFPQFATLEEAFSQACQDAVPGDTLILSPGCASQDQFRDFRHRGDVFQKLAKEWLNQ